MLSRLIREDIRFLIRLASDLGNIDVDPGRMEQVIMNLVVNATDAMPEGGSLTVETSNVELDEEYSQQHGKVRHGKYVQLAVSDTGMGMDAETQAHIFEPFFTTKDKGKGTGLGLTTVYGIVRQCGGHIWVYSEPKHGATFKVYIPRTEKPIESLQPAVASAEPEEAYGQILLVEDAEDLRELTRKTLEKRGYAVIEARNGREAIEICDKYPGKIDLLLSDVVMPEMSGPELADQVALRFPSIKVLFMSGYTREAILHRGIVAQGEGFLQKPFTPTDLATKVRHALGAFSKDASNRS
jgi:CheY-like chemotaxis protein